MDSRAALVCFLLFRRLFAPGRLWEYNCRTGLDRRGGGRKVGNVNDVDNLLKEGAAAVKAGQSARARTLLQRVLRQRPSDASAWLWLSGAVETDDERRECLEKVLEIDPDNPHAKKGLQTASPCYLITGNPRTSPDCCRKTFPTFASCY